MHTYTRMKQYIDFIYIYMYCKLMIGPSMLLRKQAREIVTGTASAQMKFGNIKNS